MSEIGSAVSYGKIVVNKAMVVKVSGSARKMQSGEISKTVNLVLQEDNLRIAVRDTDMFFSTAKVLKPGDFISCEAKEVSSRSWKPDADAERTIELKYLQGITGLTAEKGAWSDNAPEAFADRAEVAFVESTTTFAPPVNGKAAFQAPVAGSEATTDVAVGTKTQF